MSAAKPPLLLVYDDLDTLTSLQSHLTQDFDLLCAGPDLPQQQALDLWIAHPQLGAALVELKKSDAAGQVPEEVMVHLIEELKKLRPEARIAARSSLLAFKTRALQAGADLYLDENLSTEELRGQVLTLVGSGGGKENHGRDVPPAWSQESIQQAEHDRWLAEARNQELYAGQVVILYQGEVLGSGRDHLEAMNVAQRQAAARNLSFPDGGNLVWIVVPERTWIEPPLLTSSN